MTTRIDREEKEGNNGLEKHVHTALLSLLTLLMSWGFYSMIQLGKDQAVMANTLNTWMNSQSKLQEQFNKLALDNNQFQIQIADLQRRVEILERKQR